MHTDELYMVRDTFDEKLINEVYRFRTGTAHHKRQYLDSDLARHTHGGRVPCRPYKGLETLDGLDRVYFTKRLEMLQDDLCNDYKGEFVDSNGDRLFMVTADIQHASYEVIHFGKEKENALQGNINYAVINNDGHQLYEMHGDPQMSINTGSGYAIWGEIQVLPSKSRRRIGCCCSNREDDVAELRAVVTKRDTRGFSSAGQRVTKEVYALRGYISRGCHCQDSKNFIYKRYFDLDIYAFDQLAEPKKVEKPIKKKGEKSSTKSATATAKTEVEEDANANQESSKVATDWAQRKSDAAKTSPAVSILSTSPKKKDAKTKKGRKKGEKNNVTADKDKATTTKKEVEEDADANQESSKVTTDGTQGKSDETKTSPAASIISNNPKKKEAKGNKKGRKKGKKDNLTAEKDEDALANNKEPSTNQQKETTNKDEEESKQALKEEPVPEPDVKVVLPPKMDPKKGKTKKETKTKRGKKGKDMEEEPMQEPEKDPPRSKRVTRVQLGRESFTGKTGVGRICSSEFHPKLRLHLPCLDFPVDMNVYDKVTLLSTFFLFGMKI